MLPKRPQSESTVDQDRRVWHGTTVIFTAIINTSAVFCSVASPPVMDVVAADGMATKVDVSLVGKRSRILGPGEPLDILVGAAPACGAADQGSNTLVMHLNASETPIRISDWGVPTQCAAPVLQSFDETSPAMPDPPATSLLHPTVSSVPSSASPGETMQYVVRLENPTSHDIALDPCPSYTEAVKGDSLPASTYELNCQRVAVIPASGSIDFAMQVALSETAPVPRQDLTT